MAATTTLAIALALSRLLGGPTPLSQTTAAEGAVVADAQEVRAAIERGLDRIEAGAASYVTHRDCFSCHHQALPVITLVLARQRGFEVEPSLIDEQVDFSHVWFEAKIEQMRRGEGVPGADITTGYALAMLAAADHEPDETTAAMIEFLMVRQQPEGNWRSSADRPPIEASPITATGLALEALDRYAAAEQRPIVELVRAGALDWLREADAQGTEEIAFLLRGLRAAGLAGEELAPYRAELLAAQNADGGWSQLPGMESDAYATGQAIVALFGAAPPGGSEAAWPAGGSVVALPEVEREALRRGVRWLLDHQREDGAWLVETRSRPVQVFFDNGDPGGESQFISFAATNWAVQGLLCALE